MVQEGFLSENIQSGITPRVRHESLFVSLPNVNDKHVLLAGGRSLRNVHPPFIILLDLPFLTAPGTYLYHQLGARSSQRASDVYDSPMIVMIAESRSAIYCIRWLTMEKSLTKMALQLYECGRFTCSGLMMSK
jgi:hypothetical protein